MGTKRCADCADSVGRCIHARELERKGRQSVVRVVKEVEDNDNNTKYHGLPYHDQSASDGCYIVKHLTIFFGISPMGNDIGRKMQFILHIFPERASMRTFPPMGA